MGITLQERADIGAVLVVGHLFGHPAHP
jgi:hypothetical protein